MTDWGRTSYTLTSDDLKPLYEMGMDEFMRSKGFLPGAWINGERWSAERLAAANEPTNCRG